MQSTGHTSKQDRSISSIQASAMTYGIRGCLHYATGTYSYSNARPLIPDEGGATQLAILPGAYTGCMSDATCAKSASVGNHSDRCRSQASLSQRVPAGVTW